MNLKDHLNIKTKNGEPSWNSDDCFYLLAINANALPNHVALVYKKKYFDLGFKKVHNGSDFDEVLTKLKRKKIPVIIFECTLTTHHDFISIAQKVFADNQSINTPEHTCLNPVNEIIETIYKQKIHSKVIFDLVEFLTENKFITNTFSLHLKMDSDETFQWKKYNHTDLITYLTNQLSLKHA